MGDYGDPRGLGQRLMEAAPVAAVYESRLWRRNPLVEALLGITFDGELACIGTAARITEASRVLDLACGPGIYARPFARRLTKGRVVSQRFIGRFNTETFIVATGSAPAPVVHDQPPFPDASENPTTFPIHTFHLGLWFNSPADAQAAGCPGTVTPFNGDHTAGIQVLSTRNFDNDQGPLRQLMP